MREGMRRWLIRGAWATGLGCGAMLLGLRLGRPVWYSDGAREHSAAELAAAGMLQWPTPEPEVELPGPVQGRVAMLPDGKLIYGRTQADGTTDLVVFDPARPGLAPEPAYGLDTPSHELAPAVAADGTVYFASDRPGGSGGFDLYRSHWQNGGFTPPEPLPLCNTARDETDPAPAPGTDELLFVRVDPNVRGGDCGVLYRAHLNGDTDPEPVFADVAARRPEAQPVDRDPVFARDGGAVWFVRKEAGRPAAVLRASRLGDAFDQPQVLSAPWGTGELRSPLPTGDFGLRLLQPRRGEGAAADILFRAQARELYPWWPGQHWLETMLLLGLGASVLLLLLLHLGRRWRTLDLLTQCLLLSLLLHLLVMLWLMRVQILARDSESDDAGAGGMQVTLVADRGGGSGGDGDGAGPQAAELAAAAVFAPAARDLGAAAPAAAVDAAEHSDLRQGPDGAMADAPAADGERTASAALQDAAAPTPTHHGTDEAPALAAASVPAPAKDAGADRAAAAAQRPGTAAEGIAVRVPGSAVGGADHAGLQARAAAASADAGGGSALPAEHSLRNTPAALADGPANGAGTAPLHAGRDAVAGVAQSALATAPDGGDGSSAGGAHRSAAPAEAALTGGSGSGAQPAAGGGLEAGPHAAAPQGEGIAAALPHAGRGAGVAPLALHDAPAGGQVAAAARRGEDAAQAGSALRPLATSAAADRAGEPGARATRGTADGTARDAPARAAAEGPGAQLARGAPVDAAAATGAMPGQTAAARRLEVGIALRDAPAPLGTAGAAPAGTAAPAGQASRPPALVPSALAARVPSPSGGGATERPQRAAAGGSSANGRAIDVGAPASLLERAPGSGAAVAAPSAPALAQATPYSNRFGPQKQQAIERFGGTADTERAVRDGLRYLASRQNGDGSWGNLELFDPKYGSVYVGKTALCLLAFLGAGHTPSSGTEHSAVVRRAVDRLLGLQDRETGAFGDSSAYGHGIATYALAECYGITRDDRLRRPVENALQWILEHQGPRRDRRNQGGWGYFSPGLQAEDTFARVSITAWMVMALESARMSGIELPDDALPKARQFLAQAYDAQHGWFRYNHAPDRLRSDWPTLPSSTPAGAFCLMLLGERRDDDVIRTAVAYTVERRPDEYRRYNDDDFVLRGQGNVYFWYYGTLCCFLAGGDAWRQWNERLRTILPAAQERDGSFAPIDQYARYAGDSARERAYTTAMCVLSLEIYYRYFTPLLVGR